MSSSVTVSRALRMCSGNGAFMGVSCGWPVGRSGGWLSSDARAILTQSVCPAMRQVFAFYALKAPQSGSFFPRMQHARKNRQVRPRDPARTAKRRPAHQRRARAARRPVRGALLAAGSCPRGGRLHQGLPGRDRSQEDRPRRPGVRAGRHRAGHRRKHPQARRRDPPAARGDRLPLHQRHRHLRAAGGFAGPGCVLALRAAAPAQPAERQGPAHQLLARRGQGEPCAAARPPETGAGQGSALTDPLPGGRDNSADATHLARGITGRACPRSTPAHRTLRTARPAGVPAALEHLADRQRLHVDERRGGRLADDFAHAIPDLGRAGANRIHPAGFPARPAERRAGGHPRPAPLAGRDPVLARRYRHPAVRRGGARLDDRAAAPGPDLRQRHRPRDALAGVLGDRPRTRSADPSPGRARPQRHRDERLAHHRPVGGRHADRERRERLGVRPQCRAERGVGLRGAALAPGTHAESARA
ncbi:hypothetical protein VARIO8X_20007 [Burkholderiales bacterium 8X]|nr:hypothetical protein VARIO8X_20007 [Burkholderiales bacterium 8X]